jgi:hypothetical protein
LAGEQAQPAAPVPGKGEARVQHKSAIDHCQSGIDVLAETPDHYGGAAEDTRVVGGGAQGLAGKINRRVAVFLRLSVIDPIVIFEVDPVGGRQGESGTVARLAGNRLPKQVERPSEVLPLVRRSNRARTQIEIIDRQIVRRQIDRVTHLRGLQGRFDDAGDAERHLILKLEDVFKRAIEAVGQPVP